MDSLQIVHIVTEPTRSKIIRLLFEHHYCVNALARKLGVTAPAISQHIKILKEAGILIGTKISYQMHYQVNKEALEGPLQELLGRVDSHSDAKGGALSRCTCEFAATCSRYNSKQCRPSKLQDNMSKDKATKNEGET